MSTLQRMSRRFTLLIEIELLHGHRGWTTFSARSIPNRNRIQRHSVPIERTRHWASGAHPNPGSPKECAPLAHPCAPLAQFPPHCTEANLRFRIPK